MPVQTSKSKLLAKVASKINQALVQRAGTPVKQGFQRLPPGIKNGIAQIQECGFFEHDNKTQAKMADGKSAVGQPYFRAMGVVVEPDAILVDGNRHPCRGLQTSIMIPVYDTRTGEGAASKVVTAGEHAGKIADELGKLAALETLPDEVGATWLEEMANAVKSAKPHFRFSTSGGEAQIDPKTKQPKLNPKTGKPYEPRTWENWYGAMGLEDYHPPEGGAVSDQTSTNGQAAAQETAAEPEASANGEATPTTSGADFDEYGDLNGLAELANGGDSEAQDKLTALAEKYLVAEEAANIPESDTAWTAVVELIMAASGNGEAAAAEPEAEAEEPAVVEKGDTVLYHVTGKDGKPLMALGGKKPRKPVECEVMTVNKGKGLVDLKNRTDGKTVYKGVKISDLLPPE